MRSRRPLLALLPILGVAAILLLRLARFPMEVYGDSAAQYIEHLARMRVLERIRDGLSGGPVEILVTLDGLYPPGLHLFTLAGGAFLGHAAEDVALLGLGWWGLLVGAVGICGRALGQKAGIPGAGPASAVAVALVPALQGAALRTYYDLPMTALLWLSVALLLRPGEGRARVVLRGLLAGLAFWLAILVKWTAIPFGLPMLLGAMLTTRRILPGGLALVTGGAFSLAFLLGGSTSFGAMGGATFQPPPGLDLPLLEGLPWLRAALLQLLATDLQRLGFYPWRLVATVLSPIGALLAAIGTVVWWRARAPGRALIGLTLLGQLGFLLVLVPPLDDRFLLTLAPAVALVAGLGFARMARRIPAMLSVGAMLLVAADLHLRPPLDPLRLDPATLPAEAEGRDLQLRPGASSSVDRRGWSRSEHLQSDRGPLREALWQAILSCGGGVVSGPEDLLTPRGDLNWWSYRALLSQLESPSLPLARWKGEPGNEALPADIELRPVAEPSPPGWKPGPAVMDPEGGPGLRLHLPEGHPGCG